MRYSRLILSLMIATLSVTGGVAEAKEHSKKSRDIVLKQTTPAQAMLEVNIRTSQSQYKVDEPIFLQAEGNQDFYLYVFNTGRDGTTTMLIPNTQYTNNFFKANTLHTIPDGVGPSLVGDQPGKETLMIVASATPMTFDKGFEAKGPYRQAKTKEVKRMFHSKDIKWVERVSAYAAPNTAVSATTTTAAVSTPASASTDMAMTGMPAATTTTLASTTGSAVNNLAANGSSGSDYATSATPAATGANMTANSASNSANTGDSMAASSSLNTSTSTVGANTNSDSLAAGSARTSETSMSGSTATTTTAAGMVSTDASTGQFTSNNQTSVISAPSVSDNKQTVSYLLEVQITEAKM